MAEAVKRVHDADDDDGGPIAQPQPKVTHHGQKTSDRLVPSTVTQQPQGGSGGTTEVELHSALNGLVI